MMMESEIKNFIKVWITSIASICYCYFIVRHIPRGISRILFLIPIFYLFITLPLNLSSFHLGGPTTFYLVWLGNFKLLLFSFNQGPLSDSKSLLQFISIALLPIKTKQDPSPKSPPNPKNNTNPPPKSSPKSDKKPSNGATNIQRSALLAIKVLLLALVVRSYDYRQFLHPNLILGLYCCHVYLGAELVLAISAVLARAILGLELEPQFNEPYLATSLQDFWGRRWNLMVTTILRPTVYNPIRSLSMRWATPAAIIATFLVSGLMHEIIFFYFTRVSPTWEVTWFFVLQGVCMVVELAAKKAVAGKWRLHRVVSGPLTVGFVAVTSVWLFFPQITRNGVDQRAIGEYKVLVNFVRDHFHL